MWLHIHTGIKLVHVNKRSPWLPGDTNLLNCQHFISRFYFDDIFLFLVCSFINVAGFEIHSVNEKYILFLVTKNSSIWSSDFNNLNNTFTGGHGVFVTYLIPPAGVLQFSVAKRYKIEQRPGFLFYIPCFNIALLGGGWHALDIPQFRFKTRFLIYIKINKSNIGQNRPVWFIGFIGHENISSQTSSPF